MLRSIFLLVFAFALTTGSGLQAQNLTVNNNSACTLWVKIECAVGTSCGICSKAYCIPPGTGYSLPPCDSGCDHWTVAHVCAVTSGSCSAFCVNNGNTNCVSVSWNGCNSLPDTDVIDTDASCTACSDYDITVDATTTNVLNIN